MRRRGVPRRVKNVGLLRPGRWKHGNAKSRGTRNVANSFVRSVVVAAANRGPMEAEDVTLLEG